METAVLSFFRSGACYKRHLHINTNADVVNTKQIHGCFTIKENQTQQKVMFT